MSQMRSVSEVLVIPKHLQLKYDPIDGNTRSVLAYGYVACR